MTASYQIEIVQKIMEMVVKMYSMTEELISEIE